MKRWALVAVVLSVFVVAALHGPGHAQGKDTLVVALVAHAPTLDPHMHFERVGILVNVNMFDSLLHRNTKLEFEPSLATSWKAVSDTQWEFKIRKGVRFHNGDIMTTEDVKYSFDRVLDPKKKSPQYGNIRAIKDVRVVDPETIVITTTNRSLSSSSASRSSASCRRSTWNRWATRPSAPRPPWGRDPGSSWSGSGISSSGWRPSTSTGAVSRPSDS